jgi:hypothetical protein
VHHDAYFLGEKGFTEIRYIGWISPYRVYGERQLYTFDDTQRQKFVDTRDADVLLNEEMDGVKIFDKVQGETSERQNI